MLKKPGGEVAVKCGAFLVRFERLFLLKKKAAFFSLQIAFFLRVLVMFVGFIKAIKTFGFFGNVWSILWSEMEGFFDKTSRRECSVTFGRFFVVK